MKFFTIILFLLSTILVAADDDGQFELIGKGKVIEGRTSEDLDTDEGVSDGAEGFDKAVADKCNTHRMLPLKLLYRLIDGEAGLKVGWEDKKKKDKVIIEFPQYMRHCMKLQIEVKTIKNGEDNNIYISARNMSTEKDMEYKGNDEVMFHRKYMECLKNVKATDSHGAALKEGSTDFNRDWRNYSKTKPIRLEHKVELDKTKKMKVFFISPPSLVRGYKSYSGKGVVSGPKDTCGMAEQIKKGEELVLHSGHDVMVNKAFVACDTGDHETIKEMMEDKGVEILGKHVMDILDFNYDKALKADVDVQVKKLQEISKEIVKATDEDEVNSLTDELMGRIADISSKVVKPITEKILELQQQIRGTSGTERRKVKTELKQWGNVLARFKKGIQKGVVEKAAEYADYNAIDIKQFQETINVYSTAAITRKGASHDDPVKQRRKMTDQILKKTETYQKKEFEVAENKYLAFNGYVSFYNRYKSEAEKGRKAYYRRYEEYQKLSVDAYKDQQKYCYGSSSSKTSQYKCILARKKLESYDRKLRQLKGRVEDKIDLADEFKRLEMAGITARGEALEKISGGSWTNYSLMSGYDDEDYTNLGFRSSGINDYLLSNDMGANNSSVTNQNQQMLQMQQLLQQQQFQGGAAQQQQQFRMPGSTGGTTLRY